MSGETAPTFTPLRVFLITSAAIVWCAFLAAFGPPHC